MENPATRCLALASIATNLATQGWGMLTSPTTQDVSDHNFSAFTPLAPLVGISFVVQQAVGIYWTWRMFNQPTPEHHSYALTFSLGNLSLTLWCLAWHYERFLASCGFLILNTFVHLLFISTRLPPISYDNWDTHTVANLFAGLGILDIFHNGAVAYQAYIQQGLGIVDYIAPSLPIKLITGLVFISGSACGEWILGEVLVFDLMALSVAQRGSWATLLGVYALLCSLTVGLRNWSYRRKAQPQMVQLV
ncbi:hypothetical protein FRB99_004981 [Tulasnella sp. 403]|nr:hypothetical protein FRB99_004981 [Tulasnella sp. 403]